MIFPVLFLATSISSAMIIAFALVLTRRKQREVDQRLSLLPRRAVISKAQPQAAAQPAPQISNLAKAQRFLLLDSEQPWEMRTTPAQLGSVAVISAAFFWLLSRYPFGLSASIAAVAAVFAAYFISRLYLIRECKRMEQDFSALFPDAVDAIARMLRAGLPVTAAFQIVSEEAPSPVGAVFAKLSGQLRIGMPVEDALRHSSKRIRVPDFQFFAAAVALQRTAGGNLLPTLEALGQLMRSRRAVQLKARAVTAEVQLTAYILSALPFLIIAALLVLSPDYLSPLFASSRGRVILGLAAGGILTSAFVMGQMMRGIEDA